MYDSKKIARDFSRAAQVYDGEATLQSQVLRELIDFAPALHMSENTILDAGCGTGKLARYIERNDIIQLDLAEVMCAVAKRHAPLSLCGNILQLPLADNSVDVVVSSLAVQWVDDYSAAYREFMRVLKPQGWLLLSTFGAGSLHELRSSFAACDDDMHVSTFPAIVATTTQTITEYYPDIKTIMRHLKTIGASNKHVARRKSLMTSRHLQCVEKYYQEQFGTPQGLPVTWDVQYVVEQTP
jgi:malonyl-CoA O-methyltransferase